MKTLDQYTKQKDFLICVDSDGCAMDTMDVKHYTCFGPCMVDEWALDAWRESILQRWNEINLYTMTRGINRFKGLAMALKEIHAQYMPIEDLDTLLCWAENSPELSNDALQKAIDANPSSVSLKKALNWSKAVNENLLFGGDFWHTGQNYTGNRIRMVTLRDRLSRTRKTKADFCQVGKIGCGSIGRRTVVPPTKIIRSDNLEIPILTQRNGRDPTRLVGVGNFKIQAPGVIVHCFGVEYKCA